MAVSEDKEVLQRLPPPDDLVASLDEVGNAIEGLSHGELIRLERYARYRIRGLGPKSSGRDHEDLLREAMTLTLAGTRRWKKANVDFFTHLVGVMRSLSSHWAEAFTHREADPAEYETVAASTPDAERVVGAREELALIRSFFADDPAVPSIIEGFREGLTGEEIQRASGLTKNEFESAVRRLRRGVAQLRKERMN